MTRHRAVPILLVALALVAAFAIDARVGVGQINRDPNIQGERNTVDGLDEGHYLDEGQYGDLPPLPHAPLDDVESTPPRTVEPSTDVAPGRPPMIAGPNQPEVDMDAASPADERGARFDQRTGRLIQAERVPLEKMRQLEEERRGPVPEGAWQRAWDHIQRMPAAEPPAPAATPEPQSSFSPLNRWMVRLWEAFGPRAAWAQSYQWTQIGPAPFLSGQYAVSGFASEVAIDPSDGTMNTLYLGTLGGIFKTANGGQNWTPVTDDQAEPLIRKVVAHPTVSGAVFGGSGIGFITWVDGRSAGVLRSLRQGGAGSWCKIGPAWPPGTANSASTIAVYKLVFDSNARLYAGTDHGLFYSANSTVTDCNSVTWAQLSKSSYNSTGLPMRSDGTPEIVSGMRVGAWSVSTLYASIAWSPSGNNGVYRSTNSGTNWTQINGSGQSALPSDGQVEYMALTPHPSTTNQDTLYAVVDAASNPSTPTCVAGGERLYKATHNGTTFSGWSRITATKQCTTAQDCCENSASGGCGCANGWCSPSPDCNFNDRSVAVSPTDENVVALGNAQLFRSVTGGGNNSFMQFGRGVQGMHDDFNDLTFAADGRTLFIGTDGGVWKSPNFGDKTVTPTFQDLNGDLANTLFYHGSLAPSNHTESAGGMQDNGWTKGGNTSTWYQLIGGDGFGSLIDTKNYNLIYFANPLTRSTDGGGSFYSITNNPSCPFPLYLPYQAFPVATDPGSNNVLLAYSDGARKVYRTANATTTNPSDVCWQSITANASLPTFTTVAVAPSATPPSGLAFGAGYQTGVWRTTNATIASTWAQSVVGLPAGRNLTSIAFAPGATCTATTCTVYVTADGFNDSVPGHVFRSVDAGQTWQDISGNLPDVPANSVVAHPTSSGVLYVSTAMGIYQGTYNGTSWTWGTFMNGFPPAGDIRLLATHPDAGLIRAWTYGRSVWEAQLSTPSNPDQKVNTVSGVTGTMHNSTRITSGNTGQNYAVAWIDDRVGANNWHPYYRGYKYDVNGQPVALATDVKVDDGTPHVAQGVAMSGHPTEANLPWYDSMVAWYDDRVSPGVSQHVYFKYVGSDGYFPWPDQRADTASVNATNPAITWQQGLDFALAWQADRGDGSGKHDIYTRFFGVSGGAKGPQQKVSTATWDATTPAVVSDLNSNVFVAWEEFDTATQNGRIMISKYTRDGVWLVGPVQMDNNGVTGTERHEVAPALDGLNNVVAAWWERKSDGTSNEAIFRRRLNNTLGFLENETLVNQPPVLPPGAQRQVRVGVATDTSNNFVITWDGTVNDATAQHWNLFARSFNASGSVLKDFRVDLTPRTATLQSARVVRSSQSGKFAYAWRDNRLGAISGAMDVYTRVVGSLQ